MNWLDVIRSNINTIEYELNEDEKDIIIRIEKELDKSYSLEYKKLLDSLFEMFKYNDDDCNYGGIIDSYLLNHDYELSDFTKSILIYIRFCMSKNLSIYLVNTLFRLLYKNSLAFNEVTMEELLNNYIDSLEG